MRKRGNRLGGDRFFQCVNGLCLVLLGLLFLYPLYFVLIASVSSPDSVNAGQVVLAPKGFSLEAYRIILKDSRIFTGYRNSILYTVSGTALNVFLTMLCGYALSRRDFILRRFMSMYLLVTMFLSGGLVPTFLLVRSLGLYNRPIVMVLLGAASVWNIMIARTWFSTSISEDLREAASIDGCGTARYFFGIVLPLSHALTAVLALFYAVGHWNSYFNAMIYLSKYDYYPLQIILRDILISNELSSNMVNVIDFEREGDLGRYKELIKYAIVIVSSLPMLVLYPFVQRHFVQGVMVGSLKG